VRLFTCMVWSVVGDSPLTPSEAYIQHFNTLLSYRHGVDVIFCFFLCFSELVFFVSQRWVGRKDLGSRSWVFYRVCASSTEKKTHQKKTKQKKHTPLLLRSHKQVTNKAKTWKPKKGMLFVFVFIIICERHFRIRKIKNGRGGKDRDFFCCSGVLCYFFVFFCIFLVLHQEARFITFFMNGRGEEGYEREKKNERQGCLLMFVGFVIFLEVVFTVFFGFWNSVKEAGERKRRERRKGK